MQTFTFMNHEIFNWLMREETLNLPTNQNSELSSKNLLRYPGFVHSSSEQRFEVSPGQALWKMVAPEQLLSVAGGVSGQVVYLTCISNQNHCDFTALGIENPSLESSAPNLWDKREAFARLKARQLSLQDLTWLKINLDDEPLILKVAQHCALLWVYDESPESVVQGTCSPEIVIKINHEESKVDSLPEYLGSPREEILVKVV